MPGRSKIGHGLDGSGAGSDGKGAAFRVGLFAVIERGGEYLLARRRDIGLWNLPGGGLEPGETVEEGLAREVGEEIGVTIRVVRLVGVYSKPQKREVVLTFLCKLTGDQEPGVSDEVSEVGWFRPDQLPDDTLPKHRQRVTDAALGQPEAILRAQTTPTADDQRFLTRQ
ncbi:MAG TPA: NUDIX domain-containing protein [Ktedonobacterales bacterium]|nr:NUDIX domain-containing protein [Ktedonobacterales bacterium]